ncbi:tyrosine-type recombinase/integrase [Azonexus hydrophilus]|uniref:tyrosine-type recombinase/integrase n=1 Tax=Azonexus hydrophilus TaxID=418702 RepID=UPI001F06AAED|nr:integrase family protein [Azonexus hydrophilus]
MATIRVHLTLERIRKLSLPDGKHAIYVFDDDPRHLSVRVTPAGAKTFVYAGKLNKVPLRITIGSVDTWNLDEARAEARRLQTLVDSGRDPRQVKAEIAAADEAAREAAVRTKESEQREKQRQQVTFGKAWGAYIGARRVKWGERNLRDHEQLILPERTKAGKVLKAGVLASLAPRPLASIDSVIVRDWLEMECAQRPTQAALGFRLLRAFFNWCADHAEYRDIVQPGICGSKAVRENVPKAKAKDDCLQREQLRLWFEGVRTIRNRRTATYLQGMLITGARPNELAGLKWSDVDFQWHSLMIRDKVEGERVIPLTPYLESLLRELKAWNQTPPPAYRILHGRKVANNLEKWKPSEFVFSSSRSMSGQIENAGTIHREMLRNLGITNVTLHGLRRSFGSLSEWCEVPVGIVAQIQGHKPSATAEKHYRVRPLDLLRMWHTKIEGWMLEQAGIEQPKEDVKPGLRAINA